MKDNYKEIPSEFWSAGMLGELLESDKKDSKHSKYATRDKNNIIQPREKGSNN